MAIKVALFILEGPTDENALAPYLYKIVSEARLKMNIKITYGDKTSEPAYYGSTSFVISPHNIEKYLEELVISFLNSPEVKKEKVLKAKNIEKIYYVTDTDNCFHEHTPSRINKRGCFEKILKTREIEVYQNEIIRAQEKRKQKQSRCVHTATFNTIFFSRHLEAITINNCNVDICENDKKNESIKFGEKLLTDPNFANEVFRNPEIKTWNSYQDSYDGIKECDNNERACNMNNLMDEY